MRPWAASLLVVVVLGSSGCAVTVAKRSPWDVQRLEQLSDELNQFKSLSGLQAGEAAQLQHVKDRLTREVGSSEVVVGYDERGVVTRFLDQVLFGSGQADVRRSARPVLNRVAKVLRDIPGQPIGIEGHTDSQPIRVSGWASNEALSMARAEAVASYFADKHRVSRERMTIIGYGEDRPIADNGSADGRRKNRRVEIIVLPHSLGESYEEEAQRVTESRTYVK